MAKQVIPPTVDPGDASAPPMSFGPDESGRGSATTGPVPKLEGFQIIGRLGEGGMGVVWRAIQLSTKRQVALKLMSTALFGSERARLRFEREVELTARLEHPNIARVYDSGIDSGVYFYAMELVEGGVPLDAYAREHGLPQRETLGLMSRVCRAVEHAHQRGVIHRDLKPSNVLVTPDGQPHVLDFGLAKAMLADGSGLAISMDGEVAGTPSYMSPEQAAGRGDKIDTRSDVYSLGVILYQLLTDHLPHEPSATDSSRFALMRSIVEEDVQSPRRFRRDIDKELEVLLLKALAREAEQRYGTAGELAGDIDKYLSGDPIGARSPTLTYLLGKRLRKHKLPIAAAAAMAVALAGLALHSYVRVTHERDTANAARQESDLARRLAEQQRAQALEQERQAQLRLAESYVAHGDALAAADNWLDARSWYNSSCQLYASLLPSKGASGGELAQFEEAQLARWESGRHAPAALRKFSLDRSEGLFQSFRWLPDGRRALYGDSQGFIGLIDGATGRRFWRVRLPLDPGGVIAAEASATQPSTAVSSGKPDEQKAFLQDACFRGNTAVVSYNHNIEGATVALWDLEQGRELRRFRNSAECRYSVALSPDGRLVAILQEPFGSEGVLKGGWVVEVLGIDDARNVATLPAGPMQFMMRAEFVDHGRKLAVWGHNGMRIWSTADWKMLYERPHDGGTFFEKRWSVQAVSPDGNRALLENHTGRRWFLDLKTNAELVCTGGSPAALETYSSCAGHFSPDGRHALINSADQNVRMWDASTGRADKQFPAWGGAFSSVGNLVVTKFNSEARWLPIAVASDAADVGFNERVEFVAISPDGLLGAVASARQARVTIIDLPTRKVLRNIRLAKEGTLRALLFAPEPDSHVLVCAADNAVQWRELLNDRTISRVPYPDNSETLAFSPDLRRLAISDRQDQVSVLALPTGDRICQFGAVDSEIRRMAISSDGGRILAVCMDDTARLWETSTGRQISGWTFSSRYGGECRFSSKGDRIFVLDQYGVLGVYDAITAKKLFGLSGTERMASNCLTISADETRAVFERMAEAKTVLEFWDIPNRRRIRRIELPRQQAMFRATPDLRRLVLGFHDGRISVWDFEPIWGQGAVELAAIEKSAASAIERFTAGKEDAADLGALGKWYAAREADQWAVELLEEARRAGQTVSPLMLARCYWRLGRDREAAVEFAAAKRAREAPADYLDLCIAATSGSVSSTSASATAP